MHLTADRKGKIEKESSVQEWFLEQLYGHKAGRMLLKPLISPALSVSAGKVLDSRLSAILIPFFIWRCHIDMKDFELAAYASYNDFFKRKLADGARIIEQTGNYFISPCDSRLSVYKIEKDCEFTVKHTRYTVQSLLKSGKLAEKFKGGYVWIFRLCVDDYHRYIYTDNGTVSKNRRIKGVFHTVNPAANEAYPIYKENTREYCLLKSEHFGTILQMEVGAMLAGRIENRKTGRTVCRGQERGNFAFGGSTVILITQKGRVLPDGDILRYSKSGIETKVRTGEKIGKKWIKKSEQDFDLP